MFNGITDATLAMRARATVRLRLVNVANGRLFNLRLPGHTWRVIGHDDRLLPKPYDTETFFFQVFAKNGLRQPLESMGNKDTIIVPMKSSMKLVTRFDEPGHWMYHCHILEHAEGGMMGEVHVE